MGFDDVHTFVFNYGFKVRLHKERTASFHKCVQHYPEKRKEHLNILEDDIPTFNNK